MKKLKKKKVAAKTLKERQKKVKAQTQIATRTAKSHSRRKDEVSQYPLLDCYT